jgi:hypothetical protein
MIHATAGKTANVKALLEGLPNISSMFQFRTYYLGASLIIH